jgi:hypothetical protein
VTYVASVTRCRIVFPASRVGNGYTAFLVSDIAVLVTGGAGFVGSTGGALIGAAAPPVDERSLPKPLSPEVFRD